jgi:hypothetical protein
MFTEVEPVSTANGVDHGGDHVSLGDADLGGDTVPAGVIAPGGAPHWGGSWGTFLESEGEWGSATTKIKEGVIGKHGGTLKVVHIIEEKVYTVLGEEDEKGPCQ